MRAPVKENYILKRLEADDLAALRPNLKPFTMVRGTVVHRSKTQIDQVYFPLNGMISILAVTKSGEQIETAVVGREGVVVTTLRPAGQVEVDGRRYAAAVEVGTVEAGAAVVVRGRTDFGLIVERSGKIN